MIDFTLPELGENITAGDVLRVLVKPGDTLAKDQPVLELETDKATIEVPSSVAGQIKDVKVKAGDKVSVGQAILSVDDSAAPAAQQPAKKGAAPAAAAKAADGPAASSSDNEKAAPSSDSAKPEDTRTKRSAEPAAADGPERTRDEPASEGRGAASHGGDKVVDISRGARAAAEPAAPEQPVAPAAPSVRRMARELGINIDQVGGSGPHGRISVDDVKAQAKRLVAGGAGGNGTALAGEPLPDFTRWGDVERQPMKAVRRKTAQHLSVAWATIPHVTQHDLADITGLEELRKRYAPKAEAAGGNLTITAIAA